MTVSFDFDGVLAKSPFAHGVLYPALDELAKGHARTAGCSAADALRELREEIWSEHRRRIASEAYVEAYHWGDIARGVARKIGQPSPGSFGALTQVFADQMTHQNAEALLYPHAHETLSLLREKGVSLILITNGYRDYQLPFVQALGLAGFFDKVFASDDLGSVKPAVEAFTAAFNGYEDDDRYHVGDSLTQDVVGARRAGIGPVWVHHDLPENLARLAPRERAVSPELAPVLREKLEAELARTPNLREDRGIETEAQPEAVVSSLDELGILFFPGE